MLESQFGRHPWNASTDNEVAHLIFLGSQHLQKVKIDVASAANYVFSFHDISDPPKRTTEERKNTSRMTAFCQQILFTCPQMNGRKKRKKPPL